MITEKLPAINVKVSQKAKRDWKMILAKDNLNSRELLEKMIELYKIKTNQ